MILEKTLKFIKEILEDIENVLAKGGTINFDFEVQLETLLTAVKEMVLQDKENINLGDKNE